MLEDAKQFLPPPDQNIYSLGAVCGLLRISPPQLKTLMEATDTRFAMMIDGVGYLKVGDFNIVAAKCREIVDEIRVAADAYKAN